MNKNDENLFMSLKNDFGKSHNMMLRYIRGVNKIPAEMCMAAEILSKGRLKANMLRPDIFTETPDLRYLAETCKDTFEDIDFNLGGSYKPFIAILNFLENQQPVLYEEVINHIKNCKGGENFVKIRTVHKHNECNQ